MVKKAPLPGEPTFFIFRIAGSTVYCQPSVSQTKVPGSTQVDWEDKQWSLPNWVKAFQAISNEGDETVTSEDIQTGVRMLDEAEQFRTPSKKRQFSAEMSESFNLIPIPSHRRGLPKEGDPGLDIMIEGGTLGKGGLTRIVSRVETSMVEMGKVLEEVTVMTNRRFGDAEDSVILMSAAVQNLMSSLGPSVELDPRFEAPTLWGTTAFIGEELTCLEAVVRETRSEVEMATTTAKNAVNIMEKVQEDKSKETVKVREILSFVIGRAQALGLDLETIKAKVAQMSSESKERSPAKAGLSKKQRRADSMLDGGHSKMDDILNLLSGDPQNIPEGEDSDYDHDKDVEEEQRQKMEAMSIQMISLAKDIGMLKANTEDKTIKFGGLGLRDLAECNAWVKEKFSSLRYGLIMDPLLMLDRIFGSDDMDADSQFKVLESRVKLKIKTGAEAAAIKALHFIRPRLFHKGRVAMTSERNTSKLSKLPNYKAWKSGGEGVMIHVIKQMNLMYTTTMQDIEFAFGFDQERRDAKSVAMASLNATVTFTTQLLGFIDSLYQKLHSDSKFSVDQAWALTTQILDRICEDLYSPKEGVAEAMTVEDPASICSHLLWASFRTHDIMKVYLDSHFENHPTITAEYVKFLATNSGFDKVEQMEATVKLLKERLDKAVDAAEKATKKGQEATDKFSLVNKEMEALKKRLQALEGKSK
jgi:hypothetical protein